MWFKNWWLRFRYRYQKRKRIHQKSWGTNTETLLFLSDSLGSLSHLLVDENWHSKYQLSYWLNVDSFITHVNEAVRSIEEQGIIVRHRGYMIEPRYIQLHDFFLTEQRVPLTIQEIVPPLIAMMKRYAAAMVKIKTVDEIYYNHYVRRYTPLMEWVIGFTQNLCDLVSEE